MKERYMNFIKDGYYNYCDTRRIDKKEALKKIAEILKGWSQWMSYTISYDEEFYFRKIVDGTCKLSINGFSSFTFDEFKVIENCDRSYEYDEDWKFELECWRSEDNKRESYNNPKVKFSMNFDEYSYREVSIDGIIWKNKKKSSLSNDVELVILTSQKI